MCRKAHAHNCHEDSTAIQQSWADEIVHHLQRCADQQGGSFPLKTLSLVVHNFPLIEVVSGDGLANRPESDPKSYKQIGRHVHSSTYPHIFVIGKNISTQDVKLAKSSLRCSAPKWRLRATLVIWAWTPEPNWGSVVFAPNPRNLAGNSGGDSGWTLRKVETYYPRDLPLVLRTSGQ